MNRQRIRRIAGRALIIFCLGVVALVELQGRGL